MFYCEIDKEEYIFKQNDEGSCFFLLGKGKLCVIINGDEKRILEPGASNFLIYRFWRIGFTI